MAKYDGLIIPRSYNDYINKSDPIGVLQALALNGVMDAAPTENSEKPAKSGGIYTALAGKQPALTFDDVPTDGSNNPVKSSGIFAANAVIMANNKTLSGVAISAGSVVRVLFTAALTGSDATTGLTLKYNGNTYAVKVGKNGAFANFLANNIDGSYIYCQAYTTLELMFDGSQFIIMGNPVVISSADYTIYTDGSKVNKKSQNYNLIITNPVIRGGRVIYYKTGNIITIQFDRLNTSDVTTNSSVEVGTIPEGFRPNSNYRDVAAGVVCGTTSGNRQKFSVTVSKNGVITIYNDYGNLSNTAFYATGSISYTTDL